MVEPSRPRPLSARDQELLVFAAEHRLVLADQVAVLLGVGVPTAAARLRALTASGHLRSARPLAGPGCHQIERRGLRAIDSPLPRPRDVDLAGYRHDVALGWVWLAARRGVFGRLHATVSERQMRSQDGRAGDGHAGNGRAADERLGVHLPGPGPRGGERRHYPDLLLDLSSGHRVAVELELTPKSRRRLREILGGYAIDPRIDAVLYLVDRPEIGRAVEREAAALGIGRMVHVQRVALERGGPAHPAPARELNRAPSAERAR